MTAMKHAVAGAMLLLSFDVAACPACASAQRGTPGLLHVALVVLPFIVAAIAARAIVAAMRDD